MGFVDFQLFSNAYFVFIEPIQNVVFKSEYYSADVYMEEEIEPIQNVVFKLEI